MDFRKLLGSDNRTRKANKNIILSLGIKGIDTVVQLLLVPVALGYLNSYEYGIWLTLNSILLWINTFDIGLGNGLRNQLAIAVAQDDLLKAKSLVSTAFGMITILMLAIFIIGSALMLNIDWYNTLGASEKTVPNLTSIVYVSFALFCLNFMLKFVGNVYLAMQMPSVNNFMVTLGHSLALIIIYVLTITTKGNLLYVAFAFSVSPVIVYAFACPITFSFVYKDLCPKIGLFNKRLLKDLFNVGILFFLLQISGVVLFAMSNIVISKLFGPDQVTPYNISHRYFSLVNMLLAIIISPMWSAVTDAYARGDNAWISNSLRKTEKLLLILGAILIFLVIVSNFIYKMWIGTEIEIPILMSSLMALYVYVIINSTAFSYFLNGLGKLKIQIINTVIVAVLFLPISFFLGTKYGVYGVVASMIILNASGAIVNRIQVYKLINGTAKGIWNK